jgi:putative endonuclease
MHGPAPPHPIAQEAEQLAARLYEDDGWVVVDRNWRTRYGEIDLVAVRGGVVAFVEVKARRGRRLGGARAAVDARKLLRVRRMAERWLADHRAARRLAARIDVVAVQFGPGDVVEEVIRIESCG